METEQVKIENEKLKEINFELSLFLEQLKELSYSSETDLNGIITDISHSFCNLVGYKREDLIGKKHSILKHPLEKESKFKDMWEKLLLGEVWMGELRCLDKDKNDIWYKTVIFPRKDIDGKTIGYVAKRQDITDKKNLEKLSITDSLTGLYNRRFFEEVFEKEINRAKRLDKNFILKIIDIDNFKKYNDTFGHLKGDDVLKKVSLVLKKFTKRASDYSFRLGGDEFAIITSDLKTKEVIVYANRIRQEISKLNFDKDTKLSISVGVYILEKSIKFNSKEIYNFADKALYKAKSLGRNQVVIYEH